MNKLGPHIVAVKVHAGSTHMKGVVCALGQRGILGLRSVISCYMTFAHQWWQKKMWVCESPNLLKIIGAPGPTRTGGTRIRNPLLYPPELQGQCL
jgi:hypothetical protein